MYHTLFLTILLLPFTALADYDPLTIKKALTEEQAFHISSWEKTGDGVWKANTQIARAEITVSDEVTGMAVGLENSNEADLAMVRCLRFATIATGATTMQEQEKITSTMISVFEPQKEAGLVMNGVKVEAVSKELGGNMMLFCRARPAT